jgi:hypothetical protein
MNVLTDAERMLRPPAVRARFRFWLEFHLTLTGRRIPPFRRWFMTAEARADYIANLPANAAPGLMGEEHEDEPQTPPPVQL